MKYLLLLLFCTSCFCQTKDYIEYHKSINKAEEFFFMEEKADSALFYYDRVFAGYDFIFVKDLVNAAQIAAFSGRPYLKYIEQGFEQGLKLSHLKNYPLFAKAYPALLKDRKLQEAYNKSRKKYLSGINFKYLDWMYKTAIKDQQHKLKKNYSALVRQTTDRLMDSVVKRGFPGDRIIGIGDSTIFKEINKPWLDLYEQRKKDKGLFYMTSDEHILSQHYPQVMLVHNSCSYHLYKNILLDEMKKGNIHPRDIALIYDNMYRYKGEFAHYCDKVALKGAYRLNLFTDYSKLNNIAETNEMRKKLYIVSTDVDEKKREYEMKYGFKLFSGFWGCR